MPQTKRRWERLTDEEKRIAKDELIAFFENERDLKIGVIGAEEILNHFLQTVGTQMYNKGVLDARKVVQNRADELSYDLDDLLD